MSTSIIFAPLYQYTVTADEAYREGDIRLVGGAYDWEGRVEIYWMGQWGTISDSSWTTEDSIVVCRQLRHATGSGKSYHFIKSLLKAN